jgi:integrase
MTPKKWKPAVRRLGKSWLVDCGNVFGERIRRQFKNIEKLRAFEKKMVLAYQAQQESQKVEEKNQSVLRLAKLPETDRNNIMAAVLAIEKAGGASQSLIDAAEYYAAHILSVKLNRTINDVMAEYIAAKEKSERSPRTINSSRLRLVSFKTKYGSMLIHEISTHDCEQWMEEGKWTGTTRNDRRRELSGLFSFAIGRGYCKLNPVAPIPKVIVRKGKPEVFTVDHTRKLLHAAAQFIPVEYVIKSRNPVKGELRPTKDSIKIAAAREQLVPYLAIALFCGLRPDSEFKKLDWSDIHFDADKPFLRANGKTGQRDVIMPENLIKWLAPYRKVAGKISNSKRRIAKVIELAGISWSPDITRHSFGSYHLAHYRNIAETAHQMGNSIQVVKKSYENVRTAKEAAEYFATVPDNKIIGIMDTPAFARAAG